MLRRAVGPEREWWEAEEGRRCEGPCGTCEAEFEWEHAFEQETWSEEECGEDREAEWGCEGERLVEMEVKTWKDGTESADMAKWCFVDYDESGDESDGDIVLVG